MADWGILQGLGQGLQNFGNTISANAKAELEEKLRQEREARAEERLEAREERALKRFGSREYEMRNGALYEVDYNKGGEEMDNRLAPQNKIDAYNREKQKEEITLENLILTGQKTRAEIEHMPQRYAMEAARNEALIRQSNASADYSLAGALNRIEYPQGTRGSGSGGNKAVSMTDATTKAVFHDTVTAKDGSTSSVLNKEKYNAFLNSRAYREIPDKNEGAAVFDQMYNEEQKIRADLKAQNASDEQIEKVIAGIRKDGTFDTGELHENMKKTRDLKDRGIRAINNARKAIAAGRITVEEARQQLIDAGYPTLAKELK